jgi:hypothetical protein
MHRHAGIFVGLVCILVLSACGSRRSSDSPIPTSLGNEVAVSARESSIRVFAQLLEWITDQAGVDSARRLAEEQSALTRWVLVRAAATMTAPPAILNHQAVPRLTPQDQAVLQKHWQQWSEATWPAKPLPELSAQARAHPALAAFEDQCLAMNRIQSGNAKNEEGNGSAIARLAAGSGDWQSLVADPIALFDAMHLAQSGLLAEPPVPIALASARWFADLAQPLAALPWAQRASRSLVEAELLRAELLLDLGRPGEARDTAMALAERWHGIDDVHEAEALVLAAAAAWQRGQVSACDALLDASGRHFANQPLPSAVRRARSARRYADQRASGTRVSLSELLGVVPAQADWRAWAEAGRDYRRWFAR